MIYIIPMSMATGLKNKYNMVKLIEETGEFIYSEYGSVGAFMFKGNKDFIRRAFNLTYNFMGAVYGLLGYFIGTLLIALFSAK